MEYWLQRVWDIQIEDNKDSVLGDTEKLMEVAGCSSSNSVSSVDGTNLLPIRYIYTGWEEPIRRKGCNISKFEVGDVLVVPTSRNTFCIYSIASKPKLEACTPEECLYVTKVMVIKENVLRSTASRELQLRMLCRNTGENITCLKDDVATVCTS